MTRGRRLSVVLLSGTLALGMAGCGDDDDPVTSETGGQASTTAPTTAPAGATTTTQGQPTVRTATSSLGTILVDPNGRTLYTWDRDTGPTSTCTGNCAATWPPLVLPAGTDVPVAGPGVGDLTVAARPDDATEMQVVSNGKPLYTYAADTAPGDTKGEGVGGTWHVAKPA